MELVEVEADLSYFEGIKLLNKSYYQTGHHLLEERYLEWLYLLNPAGMARLVLALEKGEIIGMLALIPVDLLIGNSKERAHYCVNVLSHPDHRTKNIFTRLIRKTREVLQE